MKAFNLFGLLFVTVLALFVAAPFAKADGRGFQRNFGQRNFQPNFGQNQFNRNFAIDNRHHHHGGFVPNFAPNRFFAPRIPFRPVFAPAFGLGFNRGFTPFHPAFAVANGFQPAFGFFPPALSFQPTFIIR